MNRKISLCMIVKNEEEVLGRCLESVRGLADEMIIADTGSGDRTREIAEGFGANVSSFEWTDDFSRARNFSFSLATGDFLLWLDADDVIPSSSKEECLRLKERLNALSDDDLPDVIMCPYDTGIDESGTVACTYYRERIVRKNSLPVWQGCVHECIAPKGRIEYSSVRVEHRPTEKPRGSRNLDIYRKNIERGTPLTPRDKFYYGRELYYHLLYTESAAVLEEMLSAPDGWYVNKIEGCKILARCRRAQGRAEEALGCLFRSLLYAEPRAGILTEIAGIFREQKRYPEAIFWYKTALSCKEHAREGDFECETDRTLAPLLGLTCCLYETGDTDGALAFHRRAEELFPDHPSVRFNSGFFRSMQLL